MVVAPRHTRHTGNSTAQVLAALGAQVVAALATGLQGTAVSNRGRLRQHQQGSRGVVAVEAALSPTGVQTAVPVTRALSSYP